MPDTTPDVAYFTRYSAFELARLPMPSAADVRRRGGLGETDQTPEPRTAQQLYVERLLLNGARRSRTSAAPRLHSHGRPPGRHRRDD